MASTEAILNSVTVAVASTTAVATLLQSQQTLLETLTAGLSTQDEIREELIKINETLDIMRDTL